MEGESVTTSIMCKVANPRRVQYAVRAAIAVDVAQMQKAFKSLHRCISVKFGTYTQWSQWRVHKHRVTRNLLLQKMVEGVDLVAEL